MQYRLEEPGYFVVLNEQDVEIGGTRRDVPQGFDQELDKRIVFALAMAMDDGCRVVFVPLGEAASDEPQPEKLR